MLVQNGRMTSSRSSGLTRSGAKLTARATGRPMTSAMIVAMVATQSERQNRPT